MATPHVPVAIFSAQVNPDEVLVEADAANLKLPIRITMAAIDPTSGNTPDDKAGNQRSTVWLYRAPDDFDEPDESDDEFDDEQLQALKDRRNNDSDEDSDEDEEANGGPSDPSRSKVARQVAAIKKLVEASKADESDGSDTEMNGTKALPNGKNAKGKEKANGIHDEDDSGSESDSNTDYSGFEKTILCTLDSRQMYQQPLDITIGQGERVFFGVSGAHSVYVTGNYVVPAANLDHDHDHDHEDDSDEESDEDMLALEGLAGMGADDMSDELDDIDGLERIKEIDTDEEAEEEIPKLVEIKKGKNKRPAEDETETLDGMMVKEEVKLSKKQLKKLKNNKGEAVAKEVAKPEAPSSAKPAKPAKSDKSDKKVQFAKNLEQGPTGPAREKGDKTAKADKADIDAKKPSVRVEKGVTIDDRKTGTGRTAKDGDKIGMRYIGKLEKNGKLFDANKKGPPFTFILGKGEVIKGWDIGVKGMAVGGERRLTIPANLAYGKQGAPPDIPPQATLVFDVKLLEIK